MGTRSLICIFYKGQFVVAQYTQFDGYPEHQGAKILAFISNQDNIPHLKDGLDNYIYTPTEEELKEIQEKVDKMEEEAREEAMKTMTFVDTISFGKGPLSKHWPSLSREAGFHIFEVIAQPTVLAAEKKSVPIMKDLEFANDGLFCEWAYVVDLDAGVFEVFGGSRAKENTGSKRFNDVGDEEERVPGFIKSFDLDKLPASDKEFINELKLAGMGKEPEDEEDEEEYVKVEAGQAKDEEKAGEDGKEAKD